MDPITRLSPSEAVRAEDNRETMVFRELAQSRVNDPSIQYAIAALSHPDDATYRQNLARYLDTKGFDLVHKDRQLYIGDRTTGEVMPLTHSFFTDLIGSAPEILGSILGGIYGGIPGAAAGGALGDDIQQGINSLLFGEEMRPTQRGFESVKSAALGGSGEALGALLGRVITPLSGIDSSQAEAVRELFGKYGADPTPATVTGHPGLMRFEEVMSKGSLGGKNIARMKARELEGIENTLDRFLFKGLGATGDRAESGTRFVDQFNERMNTAKSIFDKNYAELVREAGVTEIPVRGLRGVAQDIVKQSEKIPAFKDGADVLARRILEGPDALSYEEYQQLRSFLGGKIRDLAVTGQTGSQAAYRQLYKAINDDFDSVFRGTPFAADKERLDTLFREGFKKPFESTFGRRIAKGVDETKIGSLIARDRLRARTAAGTADSGFIHKVTPGGVETTFTEEGLVPRNSLSTVADFIDFKAVTPTGDRSLPKARTALRDATGLDELLNIAESRNAVPEASALREMKDDIIKMIEYSGRNRQAGNPSGTAYMNEFIKMKNDPWSALVGFASDRAIDMTYKRKIFQKWLTNNLINKNQYRHLINAAVQAGIRNGGGNSSIDALMGEER